MRPDALRGCRAKLVRAGQHADELGKRKTAFLEAAPTTITADSSSFPGFLIQTVQIPASIPDLEWAVLIGDALHNERCALDYLAHELVLLNGGTPDNNTAFPIFEASNPGRLARMTQGLDPSHVALIEAQQPYQGLYGNPEDDPLLLLRDLSNRDKHRSLRFAYVSVEPAAYSVRPPGALALVSTNPRPLEDGSEVRRFRILDPALTEVLIEDEVILDIAFEPGPPGQRRRIVPALGDIGLRVAEIVAQFEQFFP